MAIASTYVRARIDADTKERAEDALAGLGLSIPDAIRLLMVRVAADHRLPFEIKGSKAANLEAMAELEWGKGKLSPAWTN